MIVSLVRDVVLRIVQSPVVGGGSNPPIPGGQIAFDGDGLVYNGDEVTYNHGD